MMFCWLGYFMALGGAAAFFVCFNGYFSFYILLLAFVFPILSLLVSLPGMLGLRAGFAIPERMVRRNGAAVAELRLTSRWGFPVSRVSARLTCRNLLTGEEKRLRRRVSGCSAGLNLLVELDTEHCGVLECRVTRLRVYDLLGLFSLRRTMPGPVSVLVLPLNLESERPDALRAAEERNTVLKPRPGGGPGEDYDLRPYRPGDPMRSVHWKLSSKMDELVVRETLEPVKSAVVLTYDHFGPTGALDAVFDRLDAMSRALSEREIPHLIQWAGPGGGLHCRKVGSLHELRAFQWEAFSQPAPTSGESLRDAKTQVGGLDGPVRHLHITAGDEGGDGT